ncbi:DUF4221 family protein [Marivirga salinae]|uniref:DUF4221 family protein n=1 Tax=Marivirga salinarum TaxID=3059078 RepID=A0AA51NC44_9BACT|nr:DUF4221 family protein [Marivirga sp. BDSF4-3]WMN12335.1 DUF4221 family protein [Marivirga sp. BDSF4-3]
MNISLIESRLNYLHKAVLFSLIISYIFYSCEYGKSTEGDIQDYQIQEIHFSIDSTISKESNTIQYFEAENNRYLIVFNKPTNEIIWYDFDKGTLDKKTKLYTQGPNNIGKPYGIHIKSMDSIFVLSSATYNLALINREGELLQNYKLFQGELDFTGRPKGADNSIKPILQSTNPLLILSDSIVALAGLPDVNPLNTDFYDSKVYIKLNLNSGSIDYQIPYPKRYQGKLWGLYHSFPYHTYNSNTGKAVISFPASKKVYLTDFQEIDSISVPSQNVEEPAYWKDPEANGFKMMKFFISTPSFYRIEYDPYRKLYYRFSQSPSSADLSKVDISQISVFNSKNTYISILDEDFNLLQELPLPKKYDPRFILIAPNGLFIVKENQNEDRLTFAVFNFKNED